jgi:hypothetical protein
MDVIIVCLRRNFRSDDVMLIKAPILGPNQSLRGPSVASQRDYKSLKARIFHASVLKQHAGQAVLSQRTLTSHPRVLYSIRALVCYRVWEFPLGHGILVGRILFTGVTQTAEWVDRHFFNVHFIIIEHNCEVRRPHDGLCCAIGPGIDALVVDFRQFVVQKYGTGGKSYAIVPSQAVGMHFDAVPILHAVTCMCGLHHLLLYSLLKSCDHDRLQYRPFGLLLLHFVVLGGHTGHKTCDSHAPLNSPFSAQGQESCQFGVVLGKTKQLHQCSTVIME